MNNLNPFDKNKFVGYVSKVTPELTHIHFPNSKLLKKFYYDGDTLHSGIVRSYIVIEGEGYGFLGKVISVALPEKERMFLSEHSFQNDDLHPTGTVEIQLAFNIFGEPKATKGLDQYPPVGAKVYACSLSLLQVFLENFGKDNKDDDSSDDLIEFSSLAQDENNIIKVSANSLFGRHCAIVGTTGSGKSYTLAKIIEELLSKEKNIKIVLLDATGEFEKLGGVESVRLGNGGNAYLSYSNLTESDLFALFRPSGQSQVPILQNAIKSLKLARILEETGDTGYPFYQGGMIVKLDKPKAGFDEKNAEHARIIEGQYALFNIENLSSQIMNECVYPDKLLQFGQRDPAIWGSENPGQREHSSSLVMRVKSRIDNSDFSQVFGLNTTARGSKKSLEKIFTDFHTSASEKLLKIDISDVGTEEHLKEILVNCIGRFFLEHSQKRPNPFKTKPLILFLDEAHQAFRVEKIKDEYSNEFKLDAYERIAKECRKFGLFLCLSTQRPRDIPHGVLSQMGSLLAHRLINRADREAIENASPEASSYLLSFLPSLGKGESILMGVDFPMPINIKTLPVKPDNKPNSDTPLLFKNQPVGTTGQQNNVQEQEEVIVTDESVDISEVPF